MSVEIVGPFQDHRLVVDGWEVPFVQCVEGDGGRMHFTVDSRLGFDVSAGDFDQAARLAATCIAVALGMPSFPDEDTTDAMRDRWMAHLHIALRPHRMTAIGSMESEAAEPTDDDPRGPA